MPQSYYNVQIIDYTKRGRHTPKTIFSSHSAREAAIEAAKIARNFESQKYRVMEDNTYDAPFGYHPYIVYDYPGREQGLWPGRNAFKKAYIIQIVNQNNEPIDLLFAKGVMKLR
ncbi:MAG: hypothetical protein QXL94_01795 [Candidatus Parvarchaeum sp.]